MRLAKGARAAPNKALRRKALRAAAERQYHYPDMKRAFAILVVFCAIAGAAVGAVMMYAAWEHNPQGAYYELGAEGGRVIHWGYWGLIGASWFLIVFVPLSLFGAGVLAFSYHLDRRRSAE
jgi:hypothetical protein